MTALGIWEWEGSVFDLVRLLNKEKGVDASLDRLKTCLDVTCTKGPIKCHHNVFNTIPL